MRRIRLRRVVAAVSAVMLLGAVPASAQEDSNKDVRVAGKITSISGNTFTLETPRRGDLLVQHDAQTKWIGGSSSDLLVELPVVVAGTLTNETLHASKIGLGAKLRDQVRKRRDENRRDENRRKHRAIQGEITSINGHEFNLKTRKGEVKVVWNEDTKFRGGSAEDLKVGAHIGVAGVPSGSRVTSPSTATNSQPKDQRTVAGVRPQREQVPDFAPGTVIHARLIGFKAGCEAPREQSA